MDGGTLAALITAAVGALTAAGAWWNTRAGRRDTSRVQEAKEEIERERLQADRDRDGIGDRDRMIATLQHQQDREREDHDRRIANLVADYERRIVSTRTAYEHAIARANDNASAASSALRSEVDRIAIREESTALREELDAALPPKEA